MTEDCEINFNEEKFISLKQASIISGYAKDYIGQLCRGEKIKAKRVGRDWFVNLNALISYKQEISKEDLWDKILLSGNQMPRDKKIGLLKILSLIKPFLKQAILILMPLIILELVFIQNPAAVIAELNKIKQITEQTAQQTLLAAVSLQETASETAFNLKQASLNLPNQVRSLSLSLSLSLLANKSKLQPKL